MRCLIALFFISLSSFGQVQQPTKWVMEVSPESISTGDVVKVVLSAKIDEGWKIYATDLNPEIGPIPLEISFSNQHNIKVIGRSKASRAAKTVREDAWEIPGSDVQGFVPVYYDNISFTQKVKITCPNPTLSIALSFQSCQENGSCVSGDAVFRVDFGGFTDKGSAQKDLRREEKIKVASLHVSDDSLAADTTTGGMTHKIVSANSSRSDVEGLWNFLLLAFGAGFASIFMLSSYPIVPLKVSYFTKQKEGKLKAIFFGCCIMLIFSAIGLIATALGAIALSTHWLSNVLFFILFIFFGCCLFGVFEIVLPQSVVIKLDRLSDRGGAIGLFFVALSFVAVSLSVTVPLVGSLLIGALWGELAWPFYGMIAFCLPYLLGLAMFPHGLKCLPKPGALNNELKVVCGFLVFAMALKFLSNVDQWNLIHRNIFLVIWIVIAVVIAFYILGIIRFAKDEDISRRSPLRLSFATLFFAFAIYLMTGLTTNPLGYLSGILPPLPK